MLLFCLILGCSVSSFAYRHQEQDKFQLPIFVLSIAAASAFGFGLGINANLIMLGLIPWALCIAMIFSTTVHWLVRRCSQHRSYYCYHLDEKEVLLRHWAGDKEGLFVRRLVADGCLDFDWYFLPISAPIPNKITEQRSGPIYHKS